MALGQGSLAGVTRVAFEAQTGQFNSDIAVAEARYRQATQGMSDDAIRLELAQERLRRALAKGPTAYREIASAELNLRRVQQGLQTETDQLTRSYDRHGRSLDRFGRGALLGSGAFRGLARSITFASSAFLGGAGLVYGMKQAIAVASNLEEQQNKVTVTFREDADEVLAWSRTSATAMGIAQDQALSYAGTIGGIFKASGLARSEAARLSTEVVQLASDMASFNNSSPEETLNAIRSGLVGEIEPLRRYQVLLSEAVVAQEAMRETGKKSKDELTQGEKVLARYRLILKQTTDQQGDYARTADGTANSERTLQALWRDTQGIVGQALLPAYTDVVQGLRDWLAEDENRIALQQNINQLVGDGVEITKGLAGALRLVKAVLEPYVDLLGGVANAVEAAFILGIALKAGRALGGVRLLQFGIAALGPTAVTSSATVVASENAIGAAALVNAGRVGVLRTAIAGLAVPSAAAAGITAGLVAGGVVAGVGVVKGLSELEEAAGLQTPPSARRIVQAMRNQNRSQRRETWRNIKNLATRAAVERELRAQGLVDILDDLGLQTAIPGGDREDRAAAAKAGARPAGRGTGGTDGRARRTVEDIELDLARAEARRDEGARARLLREEKGLLDRQIAFLERRKTLTDKQKEKLRSLYGDVARVQSELNSIAKEGEKRIADARQEARERQERIREREVARHERGADRLERRAAHAEETDALGDDIRALLKLRVYYRQWRDAQKRGSDDRRDAQADLDKVNERIRGVRDKQREQKREVREWRLDRAIANAEETEGIADDLRALTAKRTQLIRWRNEHKRFSQEWRELQDQIDDLNRQIREKRKKDRAEAEERPPRVFSPSEIEGLQGFGGGLGEAQTRERIRQQNLSRAQKERQRFDELAFEFITSLHGVGNQFGSNLIQTGQEPALAGPNPDLYAMVGELRLQTGLLAGLASGVRHPGTRYARTELSAAFEGPTF